MLQIRKGQTVNKTWNRIEITEIMKIYVYKDYICQHILYWTFIVQGNKQMMRIWMLVIFFIQSNIKAENIYFWMISIKSHKCKHAAERKKNHHSKDSTSIQQQHYRRFLSFYGTINKGTLPCASRND